MAGINEGQADLHPFIFEGHNVYLLNDLITFDRPFFIGCIDKPRKTIQKKNIPDDQYWFATYSKRTDTWSPATPKSRKAKILISEDWVHNNLPKFTGEQDAYKYKPLPPLIELEDHEKFTDHTSTNPFHLLLNWRITKSLQTKQETCMKLRSEDINLKHVFGSNVRISVISLRWIH